MTLIQNARETLAGPRPGRGETVRTVERALFGCLLLDSRLLHVAVLAGLKTEHLTSAGHQTIFDAMLARRAKKSRFDLVILAADLESAGKLATVGGAAYLSMCLDNFDVDAVAEYVGLVIDAALARRLDASSQSGGRR